MAGFEGSTAVVTGAGSGLGRAFCEELGRRGARSVLVSDINLEGAEETARRLEALGTEARVELCDVRHPDEVEALAMLADDWMGGTDLLVNNAGVAVSGPIGEVALEDWQWQIDINLWGVIYGCHHWAPRMKQRGRGYIVNVASAAGLIAPPTLGPYNVAKAGVVALSETLHAEVKKLGVNVTVLCPTFFVTNIAESARGVTDEAAREAAMRVMQRSRIQAPDVARIALDDVLRGRLYSVPMRDGRMSWRLKRAIPGRFYATLSRFGDSNGLKRLLGQ